MPIATDQDFVTSQAFSPAQQRCIEETVDRLLSNQTTVTAPGMLLGKIQSGKTKTFIGIIALSFDRSYDICIVLTKGTTALARQTYERLEGVFRKFIDNDDIKVYDIMSIPQQLTPYIRSQKLIIVVKKETNNLDRLVEFFNSYPDLISKKTLIIDDEADVASVGFTRNQEREDGVSMNVLATKISNIRAGFANNYSFLQVTATPYSLYLQPPGEIAINREVFAPIRPVFTSLVPVYENYIGGEQYFELSQDPNTVYSHLYIQVPDREIEILNHQDQRYISNVFTSPSLEVFRQAIVNYLVAGSIRIIFARAEDKRYKSSFIIHTATTRPRHQWQVELTEALINNLKQKSATDDPELKALLKTAYDNLEPSIRKSGYVPPAFDEVVNAVKKALQDGMVSIVKINSETQIQPLLDRNGQLRLDNPFNIFIGGQILDRGLTIENLIGFFYGRDPHTFQQDTVLQHSRMYGARSARDLAVTRFYTSSRIYRTLVAIHRFDSALRNAFERGINGGEAGVVFLERDEEGEIRPCAPNKILISSTETVYPSARFLPIGFQTKARTTIAPLIERIDAIINDKSKGDFSKPFLIEVDEAIEMLDLVDQTFEYDNRWDNVDDKWDKSALIAIIRRLVDNIENPGLKGKIYCYVQKGRNVSRKKNNDTAFTDAPDDGKTDIPIAREIARETPCLIMLKQNGLNHNGWRDAEFWWPILFAPSNTRTAIFATETINLPEEA